MPKKYCTLKDLTPGTAIKLPPEYGKNQIGFVLGLEYASDKKRVQPEFLWKQLRGDWFSVQGSPIENDQVEVELVDNAKMQAQAAQAFAAMKFKLPSVGMSMGCDPEIFVVHGDGTVFPAWEYMPSEAEARKQAKQWLLHPEPFPLEQEYSSAETSVAAADLPSTIRNPPQVPAYWDGAQAEFAPWAKNCLETLHYGTRSGLLAVRNFARLKDPKAKLTLHNVVELSPEILAQTADQFIQFRCSQSLNIYGDPGDGVQDARQYKYRCAGGHIHVGYTRNFTAPSIEQIIRGLDGIVGVAGVSLAAGIDNPERRRTYGRAGEFRLPAHGLEYRVLSNFWLCHPAIAMLVFEMARATVRLARAGLFNLCWVGTEAETREVINSCDVQGARAILQRNAPILTAMFKSIWQEKELCPSAVEKMVAKAMETLLNGVEAAIPDPFAVETNWKLDGKFLGYCRGKGDSWRSLSLD